MPNFRDALNSDSSGPGWKPRPVVELAGDLTRTHPHYKLDTEEPPCQGGMGAVYFGVDMRDGKRIALKLLPHELSCEPGYLRRFLREIEILRQLKHDHIVPLLDSSETMDGYYFFVMPRLNGQTLAEVLKSPARQKVERMVSLMIQICAGVQHAHEHKPMLVHRDLKAENIFIVAPDDRAVILDFGVARDVTMRPSTMSRLHGQPGSPGHIAPELRQQNSVPATERSDVFSIGVVFFQMLMGQIPDVGHSWPSEIGLDARWDAVLKRVLSQNPAERYRSAAEFATAIKSVASQSMELESKIVQSTSANRIPPLLPKPDNACPPVMLFDVAPEPNHEEGSKIRVRKSWQRILCKIGIATSLGAFVGCMIALSLVKDDKNHPLVIALGLIVMLGLAMIAVSFIGLITTVRRLGALACIAVSIPAFATGVGAVAGAMLLVGAWKFWTYEREANSGEGPPRKQEGFKKRTKRILYILLIGCLVICIASVIYVTSLERGIQKHIHGSWKINETRLPSKIFDEFSKMIPDVTNLTIDGAIAFDENGGYRQVHNLILTLNSKSSRQNHVFVYRISGKWSLSGKKIILNKETVEVRPSLVNNGIETIGLRDSQEQLTVSLEQFASGLQTLERKHSKDELHVDSIEDQEMSIHELSDDNKWETKYVRISKEEFQRQQASDEMLKQFEDALVKKVFDQAMFGSDEVASSKQTETAAQWFYVVNGIQAGPVNVESLKSMIPKGLIQSNTLVWRLGMKEWTPYHSTQELQVNSSEK